MARRHDEDTVRLRDAIRGRVRSLLEIRWNGNQRQMARDLAVSQGLVSKIVSGRQGAGKRFLGALASQPGINADWLYRGSGTPLDLPEKGTLPIAQGVLPGGPREYAHLVTGRRHPVAEAFDRTTRYWLELRSGSPVLRDSSCRMMVGDLLLIETDPPYLQRLDLLEGRLLGVRVPHEPIRFTFELAMLQMTASSINLKLFDQGSRERETPSSPPSDTPRTTTEQPKVRLRRRVRFLEQEQRKAEKRRIAAEEQAMAKPSEANAGNTTTFALENVVGVCVYLTRPNPVAAA